MGDTIFGNPAPQCNRVYLKNLSRVIYGEESLGGKFLRHIALQLGIQQSFGDANLMFRELLFFARIRRQRRLADPLTRTV